MVVNVPISSTRTWIVWGYVGLENDDAATAIDTVENRVIAIIPLGQAPARDGGADRVHVTGVGSRFRPDY
jgi:YVTN family beta-propeller protein